MNDTWIKVGEIFVLVFCGAFIAFLLYAFLLHKPKEKS